MKNLNDRDIESACGSHISPNSSFSKNGHTTLIQKSNATKNNVWCQWLKRKIRDYMILEASFSIILIVLLINSYRTHRALATVQTQVDYLQQQVEIDITNKEHNSKKTIFKTRKRIEEIMTEIMKEIRISTCFPVKNAQKTNDSINSVQLEPIYAISNAQVALANASQKKFNAANYIIGAEVDISRSSSSSLNPFFGFDQSNLVLVDRPEPPVDRAWCSYDKEPILTINLAKFVKPIAVSYQHSKWNESIPEDAPLLYDVFGCFDAFCDKLEPLVSSCGYNSYEFWEEKQEQICNIPMNSNSKKIGKIQLRFQKNHGNKERTCLNLIRVYAKTEDIPEIKNLYLVQQETCSQLRNDYHNSPRIYNILDMKTCGVLYAKGCCSECPECCNECWIQGVDRSNIAALLSIFTTWPILFLGLLFLIYDCCRKKFCKR